MSRNRTLAGEIQQVRLTRSAACCNRSYFYPFYSLLASPNRELKMPRSRLCFTVLAFLALPLAAQETPSDAVTEPSSGVPFPRQITPPGGTQIHRLMGTAIRTKTFLKVKVYAFGLYVDPDAARSTLGAFMDKSASTLERDEGFYDRILDMEFGMTLRLIMTRDVGGEDMADAFDGALRPRVQRAADEMDMQGGESALEQFRSYFSLDEMTKGAEIVFSCTPMGRLQTLLKGASQPAIESPALCWALFDVYLGDKPISGDGKKRVIAGFPQILVSGT
jgi:hypothetical protein